MSSILEGGEQLERELIPEPIAAPAAGSLVLHAALFGAVLFYAVIGGFFHHNFWGNPGPGSAISVSLDSSAIPLPSDQPKTDNVLTTEKPSEAPAPPQPKAKEAVDETAIPIQGKEIKPQKQPQPPPKPQPKQQKPIDDTRAQFGEQAGQKLSRSTFAQPSQSDQPVSISNGDFGSRFPLVCGRNQAQGQPELDARYRSIRPRPKALLSRSTSGSIARGFPASFRVNTASGSPTLDRSCLLATQRVDTFGDLPPQSNDQWLDVTYDCTY